MNVREIARGIGAKLVSSGVPVDVVLGPERAQPTSFARGRVVVQHDEGRDSFGPVRTARGNPGARASRLVGVLVRIYGQSTKAGATPQDHAEVVEQLLDHVVVALDDVLRGGKTLWTLGAGGFAQPEALRGSEGRSGALYELRLSYERPVLATTWAGDAAPETTLDPDTGATIASTTQVTLHNGPENQSAETACGG